MAATEGWSPEAAPDNVGKPLLHPFRATARHRAVLMGSAMEADMHRVPRAAEALFRDPDDACCELVRGFRSGRGDWRSSRLGRTQERQHGTSTSPLDGA